MFFSLGNTLPCHRLAHSPHGGLFQPTMTQAIRLLSAGPFAAPTATAASPSLKSPDITDPFSDAHLTYSTNGHDTFPAPSAYTSRRHAWVHIFPEGRVHQKEDKTMRYFKWGVSRLILEAEPAPDLVPLFIEGFDSIMHESRGFPRPVPRGGKDVCVTFGDKIDTGDAFRDLRDRWEALKQQAIQRGAESDELGVIRDEQLMHGAEAVRLRQECTMRVRDAVLAVRRSRGWPDEDPKYGLTETWAMEGTGEGKMADGSYTRDT
jgi:monolysocardiolipin acyltransferase